MILSRARKGGAPPVQISTTPVVNRRERPLFGRVGPSADLDRILAMPSRERPSLATQRQLAEEMTHRLEVHPRPCACRIHTLLPVQGWYLSEASQVGGALGHVTVGGGKTGIGLLLPMVLPGVRVAVLLIPPSLRAQLKKDYEEWSHHFATPNLAGSWAQGARGALFVPGRPALHILAYSELSHESCSTWLKSIKPDLIIADEVQNLADKESVRTSRFLRYLTETEIEVRYCCHSGTLTTNSLDQYGHHSALALQEHSPLPVESGALREWCGALDPAIRGMGADPGELKMLCRPGERIREGFRRRLISSPGVITTEDATLPVALHMLVRSPPPIPPEVARALENTRGTSTRPDGQLFLEQTEVSACLRQLASGFFYRWVYPRGEPVPLVESWFAARKAWFAELRARLEHRSDNLDSPKLLRRAAERWADPHYEGEAPQWDSRAWLPWAEIREKVQPETATVWLSDWLARDAAAWGAEHQGVIWYAHKAFGARVAQVSGLPLYGEGEEAGEGILKETGQRSVVASIKAHGTGKNLQHTWHEMLFAGISSDDGVWEQALGRMHRTGQQKDVDVWYYQHTTELKQALEDAKEKALYVQQTTGAVQKLLYADRPRR